MGLYLIVVQYSSLGDFPLGNGLFFPFTVQLQMKGGRWTPKNEKWVSIAFLTTSIDRETSWKKKFRYKFYKFSFIFFHFHALLIPSIWYKFSVILSFYTLFSLKN